MSIARRLYAKVKRTLVSDADERQVLSPEKDEAFLAHAINSLDPDSVENASRLHLGCGATIMDGWLNADLVRTDSVPQETWNKLNDIFIMDATQEFPFRDEQMESIYCEDFIEHFEQKDGLSICAECYRILKPGGVWRVSTPSFTKILEYNQPRRRSDIEFGSWGWGHKLLYTQDYMLFMLKECGFSKLQLCNFGESDHAVFKGIDTRVEQKDLNLIVDAVK
jgi:predicted SAM-dependent methyltransferase